MKTRQNILRLVAFLIISFAISACAKPKPEPAVPPLSEVKKEFIQAQIIKDQHLYNLEPALCKDTHQFIATKSPVAIPAPEKAIKLNLQKFRPSSFSKMPSSPTLNRMTVFFNVNSSVIDVYEKQKLDQFIKNIPPGAQIKITGYTCRLGSGKYNQKLAFERAMAVSRFLSKQKIHAQSAIGKSGCCYISDTEPAKNRRVEIQVLPPERLTILNTNIRKEVVKKNNQ